MTDVIANDEVVVDAEVTATPSDAISTDTETLEPRKRGRKPKVEAAAKAETETEVPEEAADSKVEDAKSEIETETEVEDFAEPEELENAETEDATAAELAADDEADNAAIESADDSPKQILLTSRTPLYRGPSKASRISSASGGATIIGKVGEFTKISYVRRGIGVQEGYVILDA